MITESLYSWLQASRYRLQASSHFDSFLSSLSSDCVAARDPYCAFDTVKQSCVPSSSLSTSLVQDVVNGSSAICVIGEFKHTNIHSCRHQCCCSLSQTQSLPHHPLWYQRPLLHHSLMTGPHNLVVELTHQPLPLLLDQQVSSQHEHIHAICRSKVHVYSDALAYAGRVSCMGIHP